VVLSLVVATCDELEVVVTCDELEVVMVFDGAEVVEVLPEELVLSLLQACTATPSSAKKNRRAMVGAPSQALRGGPYYGEPPKVQDSAIFISRKRRLVASLMSKKPMIRTTH
jgi:hypothetical protein